MTVAESVESRFYVGSTKPTADTKSLQRQQETADPKSAFDRVGVRNRPRTALTAGGTTQEVDAPMRFQYDDGGREAAGFTGDAGDCVTRAITIALRLDYRDVYDELAERMQATGAPRSARNGIPRKIYEELLAQHGWVWVPTMSIGSGCTVHLNHELYEHAYGEVVYGPSLIARLSKHVCAVENNLIKDTHDPSREGTRCVYGYFKAAA